MFPHSPQSGMASQRSCGAFLLYGRCKLACIRTYGKKAPEGRRPAMPFNGLQSPPQAVRDLRPLGRKQRPQGANAQPARASTIPISPFARAQKPCKPCPTVLISASGARFDANLCPPQSTMHSLTPGVLLPATNTYLYFTVKTNRINNTKYLTPQ